MLGSSFLGTLAKISKLLGGLLKEIVPNSISGFPTTSAPGLSYMRQKMKTHRTHHCVISIPEGPWPVCCLLSTFPSILMFILYVMSVVFTCT